MAAKSGVRAQIIALLSTASGAGMTRSDLSSRLGMDIANVQSACDKLIEQDRLVRMHPLSSRREEPRWRLADKESRRVAGPSAASRKFVVAGPGVPGSTPLAEITTTTRDGIKVTRSTAPAYDTRYQVDPQSRPWGAGFAAVGVGRDVTTGREWR